MDQSKLTFISTEFMPLIRTLSPDTPMKWGKMNAWQMVEHVAGFFRVSTNKLHFPLVTPVEHLPKYKEFLLSDKEFRENTKAPVLPEEPLPVQFESFDIAVKELENEIKDFLDKFTNDPHFTSLHPVFGELNFDEWVLLHYKHVVHHAKQFGLIV